MKWIKASRCDAGQCVEVSPGYRVWVRDSTDHSQILSVPRKDYIAFINRLKADSWD